ncbi:MAG: DUF3843 family protein [Bacteroidales bacterium]|nr:DUF3843 family protein [Bacteroidales bacterium]
MRKKITQMEWKKFHPTSVSMDTDVYYTSLANKVYKVLGFSHVAAYLNDDSKIRDLALRLTAWFEDICSNLGFWRTFNTVCKQRYGKPIPFYDTEDYMEGEPNLQDVRFLIWDFIQSHNETTFTNPENDGLAMTAMAVFMIFDDQYETAPETDELNEIMTSCAFEDDYWFFREMCEWFVKNSYLSLRCQLMNKRDMKVNPDDYGPITKEQYDYLKEIDLTFLDCNNILAMPSYQWLSQVSGFRIDVDISLFMPRTYRLDRVLEETCEFIDVQNGNAVSVQRDSFNPFFNNIISGKTSELFLLGLIKYNDCYYQIGLMLSDEEKNFDTFLEQQREKDMRKELAEQAHKLFVEKMGSRRFFYCKVGEIRERFYKNLLNQYINDDSEASLIDYLDCGLDVPVAICSSPTRGLVFLKYIPQSICDPDNPFYDKETACNKAHEILFLVDHIEYEHICYLLDHNMLPDAKLNSILGDEHGRKLLHDNAQYIVDYAYGCHR